MGGRSSKQSRAEHTDSLTFHLVQKNFNENYSSHGNIDRFFTESTHSAKLLDNQRENENQRLNLNSDKTPQTFSSPTRTISSSSTRTVYTFGNSKLEKKEETHTFGNSKLEKQEEMHTFENSYLEREKEMHVFENSKLEQQMEIHTFEKSELEQQKEMLPLEKSNLEQQEETHAFVNLKLQQQKENTQVSVSNSSIINRIGQEEKDHKKDDYHQENDDDSYGGRISDYDGLIGSPSFREYCVKDYLKPDGNTCDGETIETKTKADKYDTSSNAEEDSTTSSKKKWKRRSIKQMISMEKPSAIRNLLNLSACYHPVNFASRDNKLT